jgi:enamine deaminase RidA (YjgF/YER057c/UK114 family)
MHLLLLDLQSSRFKGDTLYTSGQIAIDPISGELVMEVLK